MVGMFLNAEENWRGQWPGTTTSGPWPPEANRWSSHLVVPPKVPDDENFAMTPILAPIFVFVPGSPPGSSALNNIALFASNYDTAASALDMPKGVHASSWFQGRTDLPAWYAAFLNSTNKAARQKTGLPPVHVTVQEAATGVLARLAEAGPVFAELQAASKLPYSRFNIHYDDQDPAAILLPHLAAGEALQPCCRFWAFAEFGARPDQSRPSNTPSSCSA